MDSEGQDLSHCVVCGVSDQECDFICPGVCVDCAGDVNDIFGDVFSDINEMMQEESEGE